MTKSTNNFYVKKLNSLIDTNNIKKIILSDIAQSSLVEISTGENSNNILIIKTNNLYHNDFFKYVTYLVTEENNLVRIESLTKLDKKTLSDKFFDLSYIDVLLKDIEVFKSSSNKDNVDIFSILIKQEKNSRLFFNTLKIHKTISSN